SFDTARFLDGTEEPDYYQNLFDQICGVVTHLSMHTGQIIYVAKMLKAGSLDEIWRRAYNLEEMATRSRGSLVRGSGLPALWKFSNPQPMLISQAIILGIIQGFTEFIPVSSTAHLTLAGRMMGVVKLDAPDGSEDWTAFIAVIQMGTLLAALA